MDFSPSGSFVHRVLQARILEWIAFSRGSSQPRDRTWVSHIAGTCFTIWVTREALTRDQILGSQYQMQTHRMLRLENCKINVENISFCRWGRGSCSMWLAESWFLYQGLNPDPCRGSMESQLLDGQGSPKNSSLKTGRWSEGYCEIFKDSFGDKNFTFKAWWH